MPRRLLWCITIVAAIPLPALAAPPTARVPVTAPVKALAEQFGMDVGRDRPRFVAEIIRRIYSPPLSRQVPVQFATLPPDASAVDGVTVDVPLDPETWSSAIFRRPVTSAQLLPEILMDRRAALVCRGLAALDDETRRYYGEHPALLSFIYEQHAGAFAAFADSFRVRDGRLVVPGDDVAEALWTDLARVPTDDLDAFLHAVLLEPEARLAYMFDVLATASPAARAFALGAWIDDAGLRARRFQVLAATIRTAYREWHVEELPFSRPLNDLSILLLRIAAAGDGTPAAPARRAFWAPVFGVSATLEGETGDRAASHGLVDAAWLLQATLGDMYERGERFDQLSFGQRVFARVEGADADVAARLLRDMPSHRMLLLGLERLGVDSAEVFSAGVRQSRELLDGDGSRFWSVAQQQGALALVSRMTLSESLTPMLAATLARSLFALPVSPDGFAGVMAGWIEGDLEPLLPDAGTVQDRLIAALAGGPTPGDPRVEWEGQTYRLDLAFAERRRIVDIRSRQGGPDLDTALRVAALARRVAHATTVEAVRAAAAEARSLLAESGPALQRPPASSLAAGVPMPRDGRDWLARGIDDLERAERTGDIRRATRVADSFAQLSDVALAQALVSLVYAVHLGDPEGPALLGANVALRHDFGFGRRPGEGRSRGPWAQPRQDFQPGVPWHVVGSLVGLDVALAPLGLHRLSMDGLADPPQLPSIEREAFAVNVALLNPRRLGVIDRDRIVAAIGRGRARVRRLKAGTAEFAGVARDLAWDGWRVRTVDWVLQNAPASIENQFSLAEFLKLGEPRASLDAWGSSGLIPAGCLCTRFPDPRTWRILRGRSQQAMMAASVVEMNLELTERLAALQLPAALLPSVFVTAMQDFVDHVDTADTSDIAAVIRFPRAIGRNLLDDYIAATATLDGPLVSTGSSSLEP